MFGLFVFDSSWKDIAKLYTGSNSGFTFFINKQMWFHTCFNHINHVNMNILFLFPKRNNGILLCCSSTSEAIFPLIPFTTCPNTQSLSVLSLCFCQQTPPVHFRLSAALCPCSTITRLSQKLDRQRSMNCPPKLLHFHLLCIVLV